MSPPPWTAEQTAGGFEVRDTNKEVLAYCRPVQTRNRFSQSQCAVVSLAQPQAFSRSESISPNEYDPTINYFWVHNWKYLIPFPPPTATSRLTYRFDVYARNRAIKTTAEKAGLHLRENYPTSILSMR
jgi:hypothetical protein